MKSDSVPKGHLRGHGRQIVTKAITWDSKGMGPAQINESGSSQHVRWNLIGFYGNDKSVAK